MLGKMLGDDAVITCEAFMETCAALLQHKCCTETREGLPPAHLQRMENAATAAAGHMATRSESSLCQILLTARGRGSSWMFGGGLYHSSTL